MINRTKGFTLIELMVVVAIIGIISAIAFPSYDSYMKKTRRADAKVALTTIADRQERFYLQNNTYTTVFGATGLNLSTTSEEGYYTLAMNSGNATGFKATATATGAQVNDTTCTSLSIDSLGAKTSNGNADDSSKCW
jgi:type IV pilus assembly protein PilE